MVSEPSTSYVKASAARGGRPGKLLVVHTEELLQVLTVRPLFGIFSPCRGGSLILAGMALFKVPTMPVSWPMLFGAASGLVRARIVSSPRWLRCELEDEHVLHFLRHCQANRSRLHQLREEWRAGTGPGSRISADQLPDALPICFRQCGVIPIDSGCSQAQLQALQRYYVVAHAIQDVAVRISAVACFQLGCPPSLPITHVTRAVGESRF